MEFHPSHFVLLFLGLVNLVSSNPYETLNLDSDIRLIDRRVLYGSSGRESYTFEGAEEINVLASGMFGGVIVNQAINEDKLFFTYNHDKLYLESYTVDDNIYFKLSPRIPFSITKILRGIFLGWEKKPDEDFMYVVFGEPVAGELLMHLFIRKGSKFKRMVYNPICMMFYHVQDSKTFYTPLPSPYNEEFRTRAAIITLNELAPSKPCSPPQGSDLVLTIPESIRERARQREAELERSGVLSYESRPEEGYSVSQQPGHDQASGYQPQQEPAVGFDPTMHHSLGYEGSQSEAMQYQFAQQPSTSYQQSQDMAFQGEPSRDCQVEHDRRKGRPQRIDQIPVVSLDDDDFDPDCRLVIDEGPEDQTENKDKDKDDKKASKGKGVGKGQSHRKPEDDDKGNPGGGAGAGGSASGRSESSGYDHSYGGGSGGRSQGSSGGQPKYSRREDEGQYGRQQRGPLITQASISELGRPRTLIPGHPINLEIMPETQVNPQFPCMYQPNPEFAPQYPVEHQFGSGYPQYQNINEEREEDYHLEISDDEPEDLSKKPTVIKDDRIVPDQSNQAPERRVESSGSSSAIPQGSYNKPKTIPYSPIGILSGDIDRLLDVQGIISLINRAYEQAEAGNTGDESLRGEPSQNPPIDPNLQKENDLLRRSKKDLDKRSRTFKRLEQYGCEPESSQSTHVICIRGPKSKHPLIFPNPEPKAEEPESKVASDTKLSSGSSNESSPRKKIMLSDASQVTSTSDSSAAVVPEHPESNKSDVAERPASMAIIHESVANPKEEPYFYPTSNYSPISSDDEPKSNQDSENIDPKKDLENIDPIPQVESIYPQQDSENIEPPQQAETGESSQQLEGAEAAQAASSESEKVVKPKKHVRKTRVVRKTIFPESYFQCLLAANTHGYLDSEYQIPSLPIMPIYPEPTEVVESYTETESDEPSDSNRDGRGPNEDTDSADEVSSLVTADRGERDPRSPRPSSRRTRRRQQARPAPSQSDESSCTIS